MNRNQGRIKINVVSTYLCKKGIFPEILDVKLVLLIRELAKILKHRKNQNRASDAAVEAQRLLELSLGNNPNPSYGVLGGLVVLAVWLRSRCAICPISRMN